MATQNYQLFPLVGFGNVSVLVIPDSLLLISYYYFEPLTYIMKTPTADSDKAKDYTPSRHFLSSPVAVNPFNLDKLILLQVAWCTFPALLLVRLGQLRLGSIWCFLFLLGFLLRYALRRNIPAFVALIIATLPALSYTRGFFFYNSLVGLLGLGLVLWYFRSPRECSKLWDNHLIRWFFITGMAYWLLSVLLSRLYYSNLPAIEMLCAAGSIYVLSQYPRYLATALAGLGISIFSVAVGLIGQGDRLGMADIDDQHVGNAITLGLPAALVLLLAIVDHGKWLSLQKFAFARNLLIAMSSLILLLSTSRGSWLVALIGVAVAVFYQSQNRKKIIIAIIVAIALLPIVLQTEKGQRVSEYVAATITDPEISLSQQTTGRWPQWILFFSILEDSPIWGVGPGLGRQAYAHYSWIDREATFRKGQKMAWHALYMHIGVETGMIGLTILALLFGRLLFKAFIYRNATGLVMPLIGILGFMTIGLSVIGFDAISGIFLGLAFIGTVPLKRKRANSLHPSARPAAPGLSPTKVPPLG